MNSDSIDTLNANVSMNDQFIKSNIASTYLMINSCCKIFLRDFEFKTRLFTVLDNTTIISNIYKVFTSEWKKFAALKTVCTYFVPYLGRGSTLSKASRAAQGVQYLKYF